MTFLSFSLCPIAYLMALKLMRISSVGPWKCEFIYTLFLSPFFFHLPLTLVPQFKWSVAFVTNGAKVSFWLFPGPFHLTWDLIKLKTQSVWGEAVVRLLVAMLNGPKCRMEGLRLIIMKKSLNPRTNELLDTLLDSRLKLWLQQLIGQLAKIKLVLESYAVIYSTCWIFKQLKS